MKLPEWFEKTRAPLYILLIFLCGVVSGALASNLWTGWVRDREAAQADSTPQLSRTQRSVERFTENLSLTPDQAKKLAVILDEMRGQYRDGEDAIRAEGRNRIREILTDDQRVRYTEIIAAADERRRLRRLERSLRRQRELELQRQQRNQR